MRRLPLIGITLFTLVTIAGVTFVVFRRSPDTARPGPAVETKTTPLPRLGAVQNVTALSETAVLPALFISRDGSLLYYAETGAWRVAAGENKAEAFAPAELPGLTRVVWSPNGSRVVSISRQETGQNVAVFDYATKSSNALPSAVQDLVFSPDGANVVYHEKDDERGVNQLVRVSADGTNPTIAFRTRVGFWRLFWPEPERLYLVSQPSGLSQGTALSLDLKTGALQKIVSANGLTLLPSPTAKRLLYSRTDASGKNLALFVIENAARPPRNLTAEFGLKTLPEKCLWLPDERTVLCAVPKRIPSEAIVPDDYYKGVFTSGETLMKINLETGQRQDLDLPPSLDVTHPAINNTQNRLFFINRADGRVYGVELPINP